MSNSNYARPMPALGFDPAPGDVGIMRSLAHRQHAAAGELRQARKQVQNADLSSWQGQAGSVARPVANQLARTLGDAASAADRLGMVSHTWAGQLATFQAKADALEKQAAAAAADQEYLKGKQTVMAAMTGPVDRAADLEAAQAQVNQIQARARQLHQDYETSAAQLARQLDAPTAWVRTEPARKALEWLLAAPDLALIDHWLGKLKEAGQNPAELAEDFDRDLAEAEQLISQGKPARDALIKAGFSADTAIARADAWDAFAPDWVKAAARWLPQIRGVSYGLAGLAIVADTGTLISPEDSGAMGYVDRAAAAGNAVGLATVTAADAGWIVAADGAAAVIPGVGEVAIAVTGVYLASDFIYHNRAALEHAADDAGHAVTHTTEGAWHSVTSTIGSWF
jgi:hypothetical protein